LNNFLSGIFRWVFRAILLLAGLVFFVCLLIVATLLLALWLVRALWARVTGQPVAPWVFRVDPRAGWGRFGRATQDGQAAQTAGASRQSRATPAGSDDVIDVVPREVKGTEKPVDRSL
jgi:hypothetical protein